MRDLCLVLCFAYPGGFVATFVCAALWPVIVAAFAVSAVRMSLKEEGAE